MVVYHTEYVYGYTVVHTLWDSILTTQSPSTAENYVPDPRLRFVYKSVPSTVLALAQNRSNGQQWISCLCIF